ncbi:MAG: 3-deoxy-7-phosphoheptulonate synthase [Candidatus Melainabacteria bacterium]|nr:3-deoxy-7-phosphoheptulonate synthase [Candidatus Melainabacteria bacterium]
MRNQLEVHRRDGQPDTVVSIAPGTNCGGKALFVVGGPCAVEDQEQMTSVGSALRSAGVCALRGGVYKPRSSPYSFQGLGCEGLAVLRRTRLESGLPVVTEVMSSLQIEEAASSCDVFQVGSRNMQNFELLKVLAGAGKPVLLKRGLSATVEELLLAAEYLLAGGNRNVILCERGIRSFDTATRNVLDLGAVVLLKQLTHLPVIVDPSHAAGKRELVASLSRAAIAAGADGLIIECHPRPEQSVSDARQAISLGEMRRLMASLGPVAAAVGREVGSVSGSKRLLLHPSA